MWRKVSKMQIIFWVRLLWNTPTSCSLMQPSIIEILALYTVLQQHIHKASLKKYLFLLNILDFPWVLLAGEMPNSQIFMSRISVIFFFFWRLKNLSHFCMFSYRRNSILQASSYPSLYIYSPFGVTYWKFYTGFNM